MSATWHPVEVDPRSREIESLLLAPYAMRTENSRGRRHPEPAHPYRAAYVRDRDRILHCAAFRRLMYKTQVFASATHDHQRTRLTHTLEVAQIARTLARQLRVNEDLTEAIALAHDLGHPPFGHAGERALQERLAEAGGFEHNRQGLRLVERLEQRYPQFDGLNLSYEVLETLALRSKTPGHPDLVDFSSEGGMLIEGQVVDAADSIAYDAHDVDDALRAGLLRFDDLETLEAWRMAADRARASYGTRLEGKQWARAVIRAFIDGQVENVLAASRRRLEQLPPSRWRDRTAEPVIAPEGAVVRARGELEQFLLERVYRHEAVMRTTRVAERMVGQLFDEFVQEPSRLPEKYQRRLEGEFRERVVADYVAGMTDRFAQRVHRELFEP